MTGPIRHLGIALAVGAAFGWGFYLEARSASDDLGALAIILTPLVILTAVLAISFSERTGWVTAVVLGGVAGCAVGIALPLGASLLFILEIGGRELDDLGGPDIIWQAALILGLIFFGAGGAVLGAACGAAARAVRWELAQWPRLTC